VKVSTIFSLRVAIATEIRSSRLVAGGLAREEMARFSRTLGTLPLNGMPFIGALGVVKDAIGNLAGVAAVDAATLRAKGGGGLAAALGDSGVFPARTIYLVRLGEETAQLGPMALRAAEIHEEKVRARLAAVGDAARAGHHHRHAGGGGRHHRLAGAGHAEPQ
jgi:type II secretory pathway component PulF